MNEIPVLQRCIAGRWLGHTPAQTLRSAVHGRPVAATHAEPIDFAEALAKYLMERKEALYAVFAHTGATRQDGWIDIEGGIGTLFAYASLGRDGLPSGNLLPEGCLQLVIGGTGDLLDRLEGQDVVTFTGSADTAARLRARLAKVVVGEPALEGVRMGALALAAPVAARSWAACAPSSTICSAPRCRARRRC